MKDMAVSRQQALWLAENVLPHERDLRLWLKRYVGNVADVDDVIQESFAVLISLEKFDHIHSPRNYLFTVAKSVVLQGLRRARVVPIETLGELDRLDIQADAESPEKYASTMQELRLIGKQISQLPRKCKEAFVMRKVHGIAQRDIARRMGISENTVEKHIGKALRLLSDAVASEAADTVNADKRKTRLEQDGRQDEQY